MVSKWIRSDMELSPDRFQFGVLEYLHACSDIESGQQLTTWRDHSNAIIVEEHEGPRPCSDRRLLLPPPDCRRSDARSGRTRTSPTSDVQHESSRIGHDAAPSREGARQGLRRQLLVLASTPIRDREDAS